MTSNKRAEFLNALEAVSDKYGLAIAMYMDNTDDDDLISVTFSVQYGAGREVYEKWLNEKGEEE